MCWKQFLRGIALIIFVSASLFAQTTEDDEVIKVDTALVNIPFSVSDREGRGITGLALQHFTLFEDGNPVKIEYLSTQDTPLSIVLLIDSSQSAQENFVKIKNAAAEFIKQLRPLDRCMIVSFDEAARVKSEFTNSQTKLNNALNRIVLSQKGGTLLRDTISVTLEKELIKVKGRKAIILISDGKDAGSVITQTDLLHNLAESDAPVYSILYQNNRVAPPTIAQNVKIDQKKFKQYQAEQLKKNVEAAEFLGKISEITGGRVFPKEIDNLGEAFNKIGEELRKQYLIGFYPDETNYNISKHQIKIKVDKTNVFVRMKNTSLVKK